MFRDCRFLVAVIVAGVVVFGGIVLGAVRPAAAHSFLVSTSPSQGERLAAAPDVVLLEFSERVELGSVSLELLAADGAVQSTLMPDLVDGGLAVRASLPDLHDGVYVVGWEALSAVDGHGSSGEFAFSVGAGADQVPAARQSEPISFGSAAASWLVAVGLAAALGAVALTAVGVRLGEVDLVRGVGRPGILVCATGVAVATLVGGSGRVALAVAAQLLLVGLILVGIGARPSWVLTAIVAAAAAWSTRSHAAGLDVLGWLVDLVHLVAGTGWLGSLTLVAVFVWRERRGGGEWVPAVRIYARFALWLVVVLGAAGTIGAVRLIPTWSQLGSTTYGRVLVAKVVVFGLALAAASLARWRGVTTQRQRFTGRLMSGEAGLVVLAVALAGVLAASAPPSRAEGAEQVLGAPPLGGRVSRDAGLAGQINIEIAADGTRLDVSAFGSGGPLADVELDVSIVEPSGVASDLVPRSCGSGCVTQLLDLEPGQTRVVVAASSPERTGGSFEGTLTWPPGERRPDVLVDLVVRMRAVPELELTETVDSGPGSVVSPATFNVSGSDFIDAEPYAAANLEQVWVVPGAPERLRLYVPGSRIHVEIELDAAGRIVAERLVTPGHLITREFRYPS